MTTYHVVLRVDLPDGADPDHALAVVMETVGNLPDARPESFERAEVIDAYGLDHVR